MTDNGNIIINIGREFGSGGKSVAIQIGNRLGIQVFDKELISRAAQESGFSKDLFEKNDEKKSLFRFPAFFGTERFGSSRNALGEDQLFKIQSDVIRGIAAKESAIFVGRCSNYILRDLRRLDVFIKAPMEDRVRRVSQREGICEEEARAMIEKQDRTRQTYYNFFTFGDWGQASDYHLCVDSSSLGIEGTADFIIDFGKKANLI